MTRTKLDLTLLDPAPLGRLSTHLSALVRTQLWAKILIALFLGLGVGLLLSPDFQLVSPRIALPITTWLALPGQLFLALVQMVMLPLIVASVICGIAAGENVAQLKRLGVRLVVYVVATTALAASLGILLAYAFEPGSFVRVPAAVSQTSALAAPAADGLSLEPSAIVGLLPQNPLASMVSGEMLPLILFSLIFGIATLGIESQMAAQLLGVLSAVQAVSMQIIGWAMRLAPLAVFGLMSNVGSGMGLRALSGMGIYLLVVALGFSLVIAAYLGLVAVFRRRNPFWFLRQIREVQLLAFSTSSSAAVMPVSIKVAEEKLGVSRSSAQFLIPLGATVNMSGSALSMSVATVFLAQVFVIDLSPAALVVVVATAVGASIGSPGVPGVGMGILAMLLTQVGVPTAGIPLILGIDRLVDMMRTVVNVTGDLAACLVLGDSNQQDHETEASLGHPEPV